MYGFNKLIAISLFVIIGLTNCNTIRENDRTTPAKTADFKKPVVVIDFTGWSCVNCPDAHRIISNMEKIAGNKIIAVAMHANCSFTIPYDDALDLRCAAATEYYKYLGVKEDMGLPIGNVDFTKYDDKLLIDRDLWTSAVAQRIIMDVPLKIEITCQTDNSTREITINSKISTSKETDKNYSLILWLLESNIVGMQKDGTTTNKDYVHNHVLRDAINGIWGENISVSPVNDFEKTNIYNVAAADWNLQNCSVVGIVVNSDTKEVITACEVKF